MNWSIFRYLVVIALPGVVMGQDREVSWKELLPNFLEDQRSMWAFPARLGDPHDFLPAIAVAGVEAGLILEADPPAAHYFRNTSAFGNFNNIFSSNNTAIGTAVVPASLLIVGLITKDKKMKDTALFTAGGRGRRRSAHNGSKGCDCEGATGGSGGVLRIRRFVLGRKAIERRLPFGPHHRGVLRGDHHLAEVRQTTSLGIVCLIRSRNRRWLFQAQPVGALPVGRVPGRCPGIFNQPVHSSARVTRLTPV